MAGILSMRRKTQNNQSINQFLMITHTSNYHGKISKETLSKSVVEKHVQQF